MFKSTSKYVALSVMVAAVAGVGTYYYAIRARSEQSVPLGAAAPPARAPSAPRHEEVEREILNGIGSIKDLKPVPQQSSVRR
ncbi:hypothetical protein J2X90_005748 [Variovorax paradoxus]|nr:hypothetical protein [Variovorax paradoxus]